MVFETLTEQLSVVTWGITNRSLPFNSGNKGFKLVINFNNLAFSFK